MTLSRLKFLSAKVGASSLALADFFVFATF